IQFDTGFILGGVPLISFGTASASVSPKMVGFDDPLPAGAYVIRVVVSANNAVPTTHLIQMQVGEAIEMRVAKWREHWAVQKADWYATKGEISTGSQKNAHLRRPPT